MDKRKRLSIGAHKKTPVDNHLWWLVETLNHIMSLYPHLRSFLFTLLLVYRKMIKNASK